MSRWAAVFLGVAMAAAILDFVDLTGTAPGTARALFAGFLVVFLISLVRVRTDPREPASPRTQVRSDT